MKNKSCVWLVCALLCIAAIGKAQVVTLENGFGISSMRYKGIGQALDKIYPYHVSLGLQYLDKGWFNLSSNVGYLRRGEQDKEDSGVWEGSYQVIGINLHYLTVNTTFDLKEMSRDGYTCFIGIGPRIDFLLKSSADLYGGNNNYAKQSIDGYHSVLFGLKCVGGIRKDFGNMQIGLNFAYLPSFTRLNPATRDRTFTFGLSLGYKLGAGKEKAETIRSVRRHK
ncbi:hypothetical protein [uncultured Parabacteroides sp.]|jgi:hypothetical protein|uniref:hypothetical protein n=1 Tax=uncultured Parabacteroides sp. TaxID=512312 RepID=UPI0025FEEA91|nr:hypothetical protein [uncultured Parabacteroides sp.]